MDHLCLPRVVLIAQSMGGRAALGFAARALAHIGTGGHNTRVPRLIQGRASHRAVTLDLPCFRGHPDRVLALVMADNWGSFDWPEQYEMAKLFTIPEGRIAKPVRHWHMTIDYRQ